MACAPHKQTVNGVCFCFYVTPLLSLIYLRCSGKGNVIFKRISKETMHSIRPFYGFEPLIRAACLSIKLLIELYFIFIAQNASRFVIIKFK